MAQRKLGNLSLNLNQLFSSAGTHIGRTYLLAALQQPERDVLEESCNIIVNIISLWATFLYFVVWRPYPGTVDVCVAVTVAWVMIVKLTPCVTVAVSENFCDYKDIRSCFGTKGSLKKLKIFQWGFY